MARVSLLASTAAHAGAASPTHAPVPRWEPGSLNGSLGQWLLVPVFLLGAAAAGMLSTLSHRTTVAALAGLAVMAWVWARPAVAAYLVIGVTPLTAGIDRGLALPLFRPSEALALLVGLALASRGLARWRAGRLPVMRLDRVEASMLLLAVTSSVVPLLWMTVRQREITHDDLLYALVMWKYLGVYAIVRFSVTTVPQVRRCLWLSVAAATVVAGIAILQSLGLFGVPRLLATYYVSFGHTKAFQARGGSTLALPAAAADLLIYNLAVATGLMLRVRKYRPMLAAAAALLIVGVLSAGEFSSAVGLLVGVICLAIVTGNPRLLGYFLLAAATGSQIMRPVIDRRLSGFGSASGLPASWTGRLRNLRTYFWPKLFSDWNILFGVRPSARVPVASQATGYVWIESGYTWLLWGGGIPLLASFLFFVQASVQRGWRAARRDRDAVSAAGIAAFVAVIVTTVLMAFDPHLTYRGSAEALFCLLALALPRNKRAVDGGGQPPRAAKEDRYPAIGGKR
jgi:hypothetical protein